MKDIKKFFNTEKYLHKNIFENVENLRDLFLKLNEYFYNFKFTKIKSKIPSSCYLENEEKIFLGENCIIEPNTYIKGPCIIGKNAQIRHGAYIRGNVLAGDNCVIGHATEIKNSILLDNVKAAHFAYVGDSIIGNNVNVGAGVKFANFRLDQNEISFMFESKKIYTGLNKLGAIIGDDCQIGCNSVLNPATFFEKSVICYPCLNIGGYFEKESIIKQSQKK
ncbi:MAG: UDP-N-acetylglucosamine diphosphorylase [Parachlamydiales bacterium]|jgi:NDP-sugar pyrophosphorylase family protein